MGLARIFFGLSRKQAVYSVLIFLLVISIIRLGSGSWVVSRDAEIDLAVTTAYYVVVAIVVYFTVCWSRYLWKKIKKITS